MAGRFIQRTLVPFRTHHIDPESSDDPLPHVYTTSQHLAESRWISQEFINILSSRGSPPPHAGSRGVQMLVSNFGPNFHRRLSFFAPQ